MKEMRIEFLAIGILVAAVVGGKLILWSVLGDVHFKKGLKMQNSLEYEKAETEFKMAINYSKDPVYYENLAGLYRTMGELAKNRLRGREHYEQSVYFYKKLIQMKPDFAFVYNGLGATCLYIGRDFKDEEFYKSAIFNFQKAIEIEPRFTDAYINLATAYYLWGLKEKAIETYEKALQQNPDSTAILFNLGMLHYLENDFKQAKKFWMEVLKIDPNNLNAQKSLAALAKKEKK